MPKKAKVAAASKKIDSVWAMLVSLYQLFVIWRMRPRCQLLPRADR